MSVLVRAAALRCAFKTPLWGRYVVQRICAGMSSPALAVGVPAFCGISTLRWAHRAQCQNAPVIRELVGLNEKAGSSPKSSEQVLGMTDVLWLAFGGGLVQSAIYFMGGIGLCMTLVGIPFGLQMHATHTKATALQLACNVVWLPAGITVAFCHGVFGLLNAMSVVGLPFAYTHLRLAQYALWPFGTTFDMNLPLRASKGVE